jgi:hypothetical protein
MDVPQGKMTVTDDEIVETMRSHPDPAFTTQELAGIVGMTPEGVRGRLATLAERGRVHRKKPTERTVIWWVENGHCVSSK